MAVDNLNTEEISLNYLNFQKRIIQRINMRLMRTRDYKANLEKALDGYEEARDEAFTKEFSDTFSTKGILDTPLTEDDIQGFMDSFTFPDEMEWAETKLQSEMEDFEDQKYEEYRDRLMEEE